MSSAAVNPTRHLNSSAYISALQFNGRAGRLLRMAADNEIAISEPIIAEVIGVLRERFEWTAIGARVLVCMNMAFHGDFQPLLAKHSKSFSLVDAISVGVDRMQRNFEPMRRQVETWRAQQLTSATAKLIIYRAFIEDELDAPKHLARRVHELYFGPEHEDFQLRTMWSLSNAFTSAFKELDPIPQFKATAKLGPYLERVLGS